MNQTAESLVQAVEEAVSDLEFARRSLEFAESGLRSAVGAVSRAREDFEIGHVPANAIADAETRELSARLTAFRERAAYLRAAAELLSSVGADPVVEGAIPQILKR
jgi:outer membrane protein TolC